MGQSSSSNWRRREDYSSYYYSHNPTPPPYYGHRYPSPVPPPPHHLTTGYTNYPQLPPTPPPQFVEHQKAKTVKNDANVHKDTIRLEPDEDNPDHLLVSFTFDAVSDGRITIYYFAEEGANCSFSPKYLDMYTPKTEVFQKGLCQKFRQTSGSGIDLGFFELDDLSKPLPGDVYPLVIYVEACPPPQHSVEQVGQSSTARAQITQAIMEKHNDEPFQVKVVQQILWVNGERYELQEIFGLVNSSEAEFCHDNDDDGGKECVICLSEPRDTAVLPCRHLCLCSECAKALRLQSNKCPICRQHIEKLMEIKVTNGSQ